MKAILIGGGATGTLAVLFFAFIFAGATTSQTIPQAGGWFASAGAVTAIVLVVAVVGGLGGYLKFRF